MRIVKSFISVVMLGAMIIGCSVNNDMSEKKKKSENDDVSFIEARNYFCKNGMDSLLTNPKITSENTFHEIFGMATTMGENGKPTTIDFDKQFVVAVVLPVTDLDTRVKPEKVIDKGDTLCYVYSVEQGERMSYSIQPVSIVIIDRAFERNHVVLRKKE